MDPVSVTIVSALTAGATAAARDVATSAIKDSYTGLKRLIVDTYAGLSPFVEAIEKDPADKSGQEFVAKQISEHGAAADEAIKSAAIGVLDAVKAAPEAAALIDVKKLTALKKFEINDIHLFGTLLKADEARFEGDVTVSGIRQGAPKKNE